LLSFQPLLIKLSGRGEIKNLTHAEWAGGHLPPEGEALFSSYYINELLMRCLQRADAHPELFNHYARTLAQLANYASVSIAIRTFELQLLQSIGFGVSFSKDGDQQPITFDRSYQWVPTHGWRICVDSLSTHLNETQKKDDQRLVFAGQLLLDIAQTGIVSELYANALKPLTRLMLNDCLGYQNLLSRSWMEQLKKS
jgi:DNA repair protein RecO (recombination protein O)